MKIRTRYGIEEIPSLGMSDGRQKCPFCEAKHKKEDSTVYIAVNSGPTGGVFYCVKHAIELAQSILKILASELEEQEI